MGCCESKHDWAKPAAEERVIVFFEAAPAFRRGQLGADEGEETEVGASTPGLCQPSEEESYACFAQCAPRHKLCDVAAVACRGAVTMEDVEFYSIKSGSCESGQVKIMAGEDAEQKSIGMFTDKTAFPSLCFHVHTKETAAGRASEGRRIAIAGKQVGAGPHPSKEDGPRDGPDAAARVEG